MTDRHPIAADAPAGSASGDEADDAGRGSSWALEDVYDEETVALIERAARPPRGTEGIVPRGRSGVTGLVVAGMMTGVADVLEPEPEQPAMVEFSPDRPDPESMPVQFVYVHGDPQASRLILRPWLFGQLRRRD